VHSRTDEQAPADPTTRASSVKFSRLNFHFRLNLLGVRHAKRLVENIYVFQFKCQCEGSPCVGVRWFPRFDSLNCSDVQLADGCERILRPLPHLAEGADDPASSWPLSGLASAICSVIQCSPGLNYLPVLILPRSTRVEHDSNVTRLRQQRSRELPAPLFHCVTD
jgi:hypothetical protein